MLKERFFHGLQLAGIVAILYGLVSSREAVGGALDIDPRPATRRGQS